LRTILDEIIETKRQELAIHRQRISLSALKGAAEHADPPRPFLKTVNSRCDAGIRLIAEIKQASPSAGLIVADFDPVDIAKLYHANGADAISVLTDETYFRGELAFMDAVRSVVPLPVLRKDFLIDVYQVWEARAHGADAVLLIAEVLDDAGLQDLHTVARELGMASLVEVHSEENLRRVLSALGHPTENGYVLGINNRDLAIQRTDLATTARLGACLPAGTPFVSESGIATRADVLTIQQAGACAMLVGEAILRQEDRAAKVRELLGSTEAGSRLP